MASRKPRTQTIASFEIRMEIPKERSIVQMLELMRGAMSDHFPDSPVLVKLKEKRTTYA